MAVATAYFFEELTLAVGREEAMAWLESSRKPRAVAQQSRKARNVRGSTNPQSLCTAIVPVYYKSCVKTGVKSAAAGLAALRICAPIPCSARAMQQGRPDQLLPVLRRRDGRLVSLQSKYAPNTAAIHVWHREWTLPMDVECGYHLVTSPALSNTLNRDKRGVVTELESEDACSSDQ